VHRIVAACLQHQYPKNADLETACKHCSDQERSAMESERSANKYKQVEYMQAYVGEVFEAVVSGASTYGFWAETVAHKCEGMVSVNELLSIDQFEYVEQDYALRGRNTGLQFRLGDKVMIKVLSANLDKRTIDFSLESIATLKK
jgi:ribonuclease R